MMYVIKAIVTYIDEDGTPHYRLYRCPYDRFNPSPQGSRIFDDQEAICRQVFPTLFQAGHPDD